MKITIADATPVGITCKDVIIYGDHIPRIGDKYPTPKGIAKVVAVIWSEQLTDVTVYVDRYI